MNKNDEKTFKVRAKFPEGKHGFFGISRVYDGDVLEVTEKQFSKKWMERLDDNQKEQRRSSIV